MSEDRSSYVAGNWVQGAGPIILTLIPAYEASIANISNAFVADFEYSVTSVTDGMFSARLDSALRDLEYLLSGRAMTAWSRHLLGR